MQVANGPISLEYFFDTTADRLWQALTVHDQMLHWYFDNIPDFRAEAGFETHFAVQSGERTFTHLWKVTEVIPGQRISYSWRYEEYPGDSVISFDIAEQASRLKLSLVINVTEDYPAHIPEFARESCIQGWNYFVGQRLAGYLS